MNTKKKLLTLLGIMVTIIVISVLIIKLTGNEYKSTVKDEEDKLQIVTTFYPMYIIGTNIAHQLENVEVTNLTDFNIGCAHDYQLTTNNMKLLSTADVIIINGGGLEGFLEDIIKDYPNLTVIDSSEGIQLLEYGNHEDDHGDDHGDDHEDDHAGEGLEEEHRDIDIASDKLDHSHNHGDFNPHIWLDPQVYIRQIENVKEGLVRYIEGSPSGSETNSSVLELSTAIEHNADSYIKEVHEIDDILSDLKDEIITKALASGKHQGVAIFHDSFAYLANRIGLEVEYSIEIDAETALSSSNIRDVIELVNDGRVKYLLADVQYGDTIADRIQSESEARVTLLDTIVTGDGDMSSYIKGMEENIKLLDELID